MSLREYKLAVIAEAWPRHCKPARLIEFLREQDHDRGIDAVLFALGHDPTKMRSPLPDLTLMEELGGLA